MTSNNTLRRSDFGDLVSQLINGARIFVLQGQAIKHLYFSEQLRPRTFPRHQNRCPLYSLHWWHRPPVVLPQTANILTANGLMTSTCHAVPSSSLLSSSRRRSCFFKDLISISLLGTWSTYSVLMPSSHFDSFPSTWGRANRR